MSRIERIRLWGLEAFVEWLDRVAARRHHGAPHLATGLRGERAAFFYLRRLGFVVTAQRWRTSKAPHGDLDLIAWENDVLCFVEVKARTTRAVAPAEASVDADKKRMLCKMAHYYMRQLPTRDVPVRFDILSIYLEAGKPADFELFRGAFGWE